MGLTLDKIKIEDVAAFSAIPTLHQCSKSEHLKDSDSIEVQFSELLSKNEGAGTDSVGQLQKMFVEFRNHISSQLVGRDELIDCVLAGLISGVPIAIFGPPGTAKSACVRLIAQACTCPVKPKSDNGKEANDVPRQYFEWLVTNHTMPEELFGPPKIDQLEAGVFERNTKGKLPEAEFVFLDEVFRGGGHILNTLLTVINERKFHNGTVPVDVPLVGLVAAANDPPTSPDVEAFYDRFPIRFWVDSVLDNVSTKESGKLGVALLNKSAELDKLDEAAAATPKWQISTNHFRAARKVLSIGESPSQIQREQENGLTPRFVEFMDCFNSMRSEHGISDRSLWRLYRFGCALDWLKGRDMAKCTGDSDSATGHLDVFKYVAKSEERARDAYSRVSEFIREEKGRGVS